MTYQLKERLEDYLRVRAELFVTPERFTTLMLKSMRRLKIFIII